MNRLALAICLLFVIAVPDICLALDHVIISEVLYDPIGTETGGEAVSLYNPTDIPINISRFVIKTESSAADATIPDGTVLLAHTFYLIADSGWLILRDNVSWPAADYEESITLTNSDAGVALLYPNSTIIDAVGWGNSSGIGTGLFEGAPVQHVQSGKSISRLDLTSDSNNNLLDFAESAPDFKNSSTTTMTDHSLETTESTKGISFSVSVANNAPAVESLEMIGDDDNSTVGIQIMPVPDSMKSVGIVAEISDIDGIDDLKQVSILVKGPSSESMIDMSLFEIIDNTTARYTASIGLNFYDEAGVYNATVFAEDFSEGSAGNMSFEYMRMTAISIDVSSLQFGAVRPGSSTHINGDFALSTLNAPTIKNTGNTEVDLGVYGTDLVDGVKKIGIENVKYSFENDFDGSSSWEISKVMETRTVELVNGEDSVIEFGLRLAIPENTQNGNYSGQITVVAVSG